MSKMSLHQMYQPDLSCLRDLFSSRVITPQKPIYTDIWNQNYNDTQNYHRQKKTTLVLFEQDLSKPQVLYKRDNQLRSVIIIIIIIFIYGLQQRRITVGKMKKIYKLIDGFVHWYMWRLVTNRWGEKKKLKFNQIESGVCLLL